MLVLSPKQGSLDKLPQAGTLQPFDKSVLSFLSQLSGRLLHHPLRQNYTELAALGFWLRNSQLNSLKQSLFTAQNVLHKPLGVVVHYTPANVDTMFIYSWVCSLLMGNSNLIRLSSRPSIVRDILLDELNGLFKQPEFEAIAQTNLFVTFGHDDPISSEVSLLADARVIWGGDESVIKIRALPIKPRCRDIAFADRFSAALIDTDALQQELDYQDLASKLWRDTQPYAQMACSSPRVIFTLGQGNLIPLFESIETLIADGDREITQATNHLVSKQLLQCSGLVDSVVHQGNITALQINHLNEKVLNWHCGQGLFYILHLDGFRDVSVYATDKLQTLTHWGVDKSLMIKLLDMPPINGIDRIVPVGQALNFSVNWDGYELVSMLSRSIQVSI